MKRPEFRRSELAAAAVFTLLVLGIFGLSGALLAGVAIPIPVKIRFLLHAAAAAGLLCVLYGFFVEPWKLTTKRISITTPKIPLPLNILHLSDFHIAAWGRLESLVAARVRELAPDLILLTGDYTSSRYEKEALTRLLSGFAETAPVYAAVGNSEAKRPVHETVRLPGLRWLPEGGETVEIRGVPIRIEAALPGDEDRVLNASPNPAVFSICLYHYPDLVPVLDRVPYDLMLCGHTHGGQIRLPWIGAVFSNSKAGRRFARGLFSAGRKTAFVSQGIGCESYGLPPVRFLCPPEIAILELVPE